MKSAEARICCRTLRLLARPNDAFPGRDHPALTRFAAKSGQFRAGQPLDANQTGVASAQKKTPTLGPCLFAYPDPTDQRRLLKGCVFQTPTVSSCQPIHHFDCVFSNKGFLFLMSAPPNQRRVTGQEALEQCRRNRLQDTSRGAWRGLKQQAVSTTPVQVRTFGHGCLR